MPPLGGSVKDATDPAVQAAALEANPLRKLTRAQCFACGEKWQAPVIGACPRCHSDQVKTYEESGCFAQRV